MKITDEQIDKLADLLAKKVVDRLKNDIISAVTSRRWEGGKEEWRNQVFMDPTDIEENGELKSLVSQARSDIAAMIREKKPKKH